MQMKTGRTARAVLVKPRIYESDEHEDLTGRIKEGLKQLGLRLQKDESARLVLWVVENQLAVSQRPLRNHPKWTYKTPPRKAGPDVKGWVTRIIYEEKIQSIICLLQKKELKNKYGHLDLHPQGLLGYYESQGLKYKLHEMVDNLETPFLESAREAAQLFSKLELPVLVHCAAGADRTPPVAALIALRCLRGGGRLLV